MDDRRTSIFSAYYGRRYATLAAKFWRRLDAAFNIASLVFGSAAFFTFMRLDETKSAPLAGYFGLVVAVVTIVQLIVKPSDKAAREDELKRLFGGILRDAPSLNDSELYQRLVDAQNEPVSEIESLRNPAWVQAIEEMDGVRPKFKFSLSERLAVFAA